MFRGKVKFQRGCDTVFIYRAVCSFGMVRVNLIDPKRLADQHLIAEYNEMLMLVSFIKKYPALHNIPGQYCLGRGHMLFFKDKVGYLKMRHDALKREMRKRGFQAKKSIDLSAFDKKNKGFWTPNMEDIALISHRITAKLRLKPKYYRYYGVHKPLKFFIGLLGSGPI